jgi:hypothetical protein
MTKGRDNLAPSYLVFDNASERAYIEARPTTLLKLTWESAMTENWQWLEGTYWYVPEENLPALQINPNASESDAFQWFSDQTVFYIERYQNGYFWGKAYIQMIPLEQNPDQPSSTITTCSTLIGSVTPEGNVYLSFVIDRAPAAVLTTRGVGRMQKREGGWCMENQMSSGVQDLVSHWAYMVQCKSGDACIEKLPGTQYSLQGFIEQVKDNC